MSEENNKFTDESYAEESKEEKHIDDDDIEFIDYSIDEDTATYNDDVLSMSKNAKKKQDKKEFNLKKEILSWVKMIIAAVIIAFLLNTFVFINAHVPSGSMENTIMTGDRMIGLRIAYTFGDPERGDIVIFKNPLYNAQKAKATGEDDSKYVKRIIGLPGETVEIKDAKIYIYDSKGKLILGPLKEDYLKEEWVGGTGPYTFTVPDNCYLMLGDNRNGSSDARTWYQMWKNGTLKESDIYINRDDIYGKVLFKYWNSFKWLDGQDYK